MSPREVAVVRLVLEQGSANKQMTSRSLHISLDYANLLLRSLERRGAVSPLEGGEAKPDFYEVTPKGALDFLSVLKFMRNRQVRLAKRAMQGVNALERKLDEYKELIRSRLWGSAA